MSAAPATPAIYTLSLHDALPISENRGGAGDRQRWRERHPQVAEADRRGGGKHQPSERRAARLGEVGGAEHDPAAPGGHQDRKSTRLNSSHVKISYAVFCLKKKRK